MNNWTPESLKQNRPYVKVIDRGGHTYNGSMIDIGDKNTSIHYGAGVLQNVPLQFIADELNANQIVDVSKL